MLRLDLPKGRSLVIGIIMLLAAAPLVIGDASAQFAQLRNSTGEVIAESEAGKGVDRFAFATSLHPFYGIWTYPILFSGVAFLALGVLYHKKTLPVSFARLIKFIFSFEVSRRVSFIALSTLVGTYGAFGIMEVQQKEEGIDDPDSDYYQVKQHAERFSLQTIKFEPGNFTAVVGLSLLSFSINVFGNSRVVPFIGSVALLLLTYLTTTQLARKRFAGLVAMVVLLQSAIFLRHDSSTPYNYIWVMFYLLSIYLIRRKWQFSVPAFIASFLSKTLAGAFLPLTFFSVYDSELPRSRKLMLIAPYAGAVAVFLASVALGVTLPAVKFDVNQFWIGINSVPILLQQDALVLVLLLPVTFGLYILAGKNVSGSLSVMLLIGGLIWISGFLTGITGIANLDYRIMQIIVFFAIGVGMMFSRTDSETKRQGVVFTVTRNLVFAICLPVVFIVVSTFFFPALYSDQNFR